MVSHLPQCFTQRTHKVINESNNEPKWKDFLDKLKSSFLFVLCVETLCSSSHRRTEISAVSILWDSPQSVRPANHIKRKSINTYSDQLNNERNRSYNASNETIETAAWGNQSNFAKPLTIMRLSSCCCSRHISASLLLPSRIRATHRHQTEHKSLWVLERVVHEN